MSVSLAAEGNSHGSSIGRPGTRSHVHTRTSSRPAIKRTLAPGNGWVTQIPTCPFPSEKRKLSAASRLAFWAGPISWMGYQYWLKTLLSPGARKEKSGWLSVKTPAINSM